MTTVLIKLWVIISLCMHFKCRELFTLDLVFSGVSLLLAEFMATFSTLHSRHTDTHFIFPLFSSSSSFQERRAATSIFPYYPASLRLCVEEAAEVMSLQEKKNV